MKKLTMLAGVAACTATLAVSALGAGASPIRTFASSIRPPANAAISYGLHYMPTRFSRRSVHPDAGLLRYNNGPVLVHPKQYVVLWGFKAAGDPDKVGVLYHAYVAHYGGSAIANVLTQYYDIVSGQQNNITNPKHNGLLWRDNVNPVPAHPTDAQVRTEAWAAATHFGGADPNGAYIVVSPYQHDPQGYISAGWCAYHGITTLNSQSISYTNMPYQADGGSSCGADSITAPPGEEGVDEGQTIVTGHEYAESVTDPVVGAGWDNAFYGEIGDICAWQNIQNDPFGTRQFTMQPEYSNAAQGCVHS